MNRELFLLDGLARYRDLGPLILRVMTGAFLVYGVVDNVVSPERMEEFSAFLGANQFVAPDLMARVSVYIQLVCGITLILGILTRWTGVAIALHFVVALIMVHWSQDFRGWWPAAVLVGIGIHFALAGAGCISLDARLTQTNND